MADVPPARHLGCGICSSLRHYEQATQHVQPEETDNELPETVGRLRTVQEVSRRQDVLQCPECGTYYLYETAYEFLIGFGGSYDEQTVTRISDEEAAGYLKDTSNPEVG